jgi:hypothetical protein
MSIVGRDPGPHHTENIKAPLEDEPVCVRTPRKPVDEPLDGEVLQELIERAEGFPGIAEKALMHRRGGVVDVSCHYRSASRYGRMIFFTRQIAA